MDTPSRTVPPPAPIPHGRTARRLQWAHLPPMLRAEIEERLGSPVAETESCDAGFTPGLASVLTCADGTRHFLKAASVRAQRAFAEAYREEARKLTVLPSEAPAAPLRWTHDDGEWVVLCLEHVDGRAPYRPWQEPDLAAVLATLEAATEVLTPVPPALTLDDFAEEFAELPGRWEHVRRTRPDLPRAWVDEAADLATGLESVTAGDCVVHTDVRDDNLLIRPDGSVVVCDWNWPVRGAAWIDTVMALIGPRGDGLDVEALLAASPLTRDLPREHVDTLLALLAGFFSHAADQPVPPTSPHLRDVQAWQRDVVWAWLCERRGWTPGAVDPSDLGADPAR